MNKNHIIKELSIKNGWKLGVHLFTTQKRMIKFGESIGDPIDDGKKVWALYQSHVHFYNVNGILVRLPYLGDILFNKEHFSTEILAHECCHLAIDAFRNIEDKKVEISTEVDNAEEDFCYLLGEVTQEVWSLIKEYIE